MRREAIDIDGVSTPIVSDGDPGATEAVVCLHGNPGFSADWLDLIPRVAPFARIVAPDVPGFGDAAKPRGFDYSPAGYTRHLVLLLARLGVTRAHLVCHDFGVAWGLGWALAQPRAVASLTLINIGVLPGYRWHALARIWRTPWLGELSMAMVTRTSFAQALRIGNPRGLPDAFVKDMYDHYDARTRRAVLRLYRATDDLAGGLIAQRNTLRNMDIPVCVVWGAADPYVGVRFVERQREFFPRAEVTIFEDSGHWPHADNSERFASVVVPFLQRACGA